MVLVAVVVVVVVSSISMLVFLLSGPPGKRLNRVLMLRHKWESRAQEEEVSKTALEKRQGHGGNLASGCSRAQVGRPNLSPSASEVKPWLPRAVIGPSHSPRRLETSTTRRNPHSSRHHRHPITYAANNLYKRCCSPPVDVDMLDHHKSALRASDSAPSHLLCWRLRSVTWQPSSETACT